MLDLEEQSTVLPPRPVIVTCDVPSSPLETPDFRVNEWDSWSRTGFLMPRRASLCGEGRSDRRAFRPALLTVAVTWRATWPSSGRSRRNALHRLGDPSGTAFATAPHQEPRGLDAPASVRHPDARRRSASAWNAESPPSVSGARAPGGRRRRRLKSTATPGDSPRSSASR